MSSQRLGSEKEETLFGIFDLSSRPLGAPSRKKRAFRVETRAIKHFSSTQIAAPLSPATIAPPTAPFGRFSKTPRWSAKFRAERFAAKTGALPAVFAAVFALALLALTRSHHPLHSAALAGALFLAGGCALLFRFWETRARPRRAGFGVVAAVAAVAVAGSLCALAEVSKRAPCAQIHCVAASPVQPAIAPR